jgi:hypothetical protein
MENMKWVMIGIDIHGSRKKSISWQEPYRF